MRGNHPELDLADDVRRKLHLYGIEAQLLERPLDANVLGLDRKAFTLQRFRDLVGVYRAVKMALRVGVGLDCERPLADLCRQILKVGPPCFLESSQPLTMFLDHSQVIWSREGRHSLRDQVVACEAGANLHQVAGLPHKGHALCEDELDVTVLRAARVILAALNARLSRWTGGRCVLSTFCRSSVTLCGRRLGGRFRRLGFGISRLGHENPDLGDSTAPEQGGSLCQAESMTREESQCQA